MWDVTSTHIHFFFFWLFCFKIHLFLCYTKYYPLHFPFGTSKVFGLRLFKDSFLGLYVGTGKIINLLWNLEFTFYKTFSTNGTPSNHSYFDRLFSWFIQDLFFTFCPKEICSWMHCYFALEFNFIHVNTEHHVFFISSFLCNCKIMSFIYRFTYQNSIIISEIIQVYFVQTYILPFPIQSSH